MLNKYSITTFFAAIFLIFFGYLLYTKYSVKTVSYTGLQDIFVETPSIKQDVLITSDSLDSEALTFVQRRITGGGINPGWVISLLETQPNIFTGRVIVDDGVYQHPVTVKEEVTNVFIGEMKGKNGQKEIFSMKKENKDCVDAEGNTFEYTLSGTYGATQFSGCGGEVINEVE